MERKASFVIGIDCATEWSRVGLALARRGGSKLVVLETTLASKVTDPVKHVAGWIRGHSPVLLALDAPLGWPEPMQSALAGHKAGESLAAAADAMFSRATDLDVRARMNKRPMEVGANLIARTAHAALALLEALRRETGLAIPLAWSPADVVAAAAIEVYPAATRLALGIPPGSDPLRRLASRLVLPKSRAHRTSDHVRDAVLCCFAGADFLDGVCPGPADFELSRTEGWIWVRGRRPRSRS